MTIQLTCQVPDHSSFQDETFRLIQERGETLRSEVHELILFVIRTNCANLKRERERERDKTDCSNCRGISPLSTSYKISSNIVPSRLSPNID
jgi:hypothetical protein